MVELMLNDRSVTLATSPLTIPPGRMSNVLRLRQNDQIADRDIRRLRQHKHYRLHHVFVLQDGTLCDSLCDVRWIGHVPQFIRYHTRRDRADTDPERRDLSAQRMDKALDSVLGRAVHWLPHNIGNA